MVPFSFAEQEFVLVEDRALFWPRESALLVADLHLEKASFFAATGQFLPPYDSRHTLERIAGAIRATGARRVFSLGDNFHDDHGPGRMEPHAAGMLDALTRAVDWVWIAGNHDPAAAGSLGGTQAEELHIGGMVLRHRALAEEKRPELSGHFHPRLRLRLRGRPVVRPCAVLGVGRRDGEGASGRMILPAFGAFTGGMDAHHPAIVEAMQPASAIDAVVPAGGQIVHYPLWRATT